MQFSELRAIYSFEIVNKKQGNKGKQHETVSVTVVLFITLLVLFNLRHSAAKLTTLISVF